MDALQELISKHDWILQCWDDRYSRGIWAVVAPQVYHTYQMREITDGGDIESNALGDYFLNEGSWLPVVIGHNLTEIIEALNTKIKDFVEDSSWRNDVFEAFQRIIEVNDGRYGLQIAIDEQDKALIEKKIHPFLEVTP